MDTIKILDELLAKVDGAMKLKQENLEEGQKNKEVNMVSAILKDGNTIYTDAEAMAPGVEVYFMNGEDKVAVEPGEYELEDGSIVVIGEGSTIAEIKESEIAPDEEPTEDVEAGMGYDKDKEKQNVDGYDAKSEFEALKGMLENISMKMDLLMGNKMSVEQSISALEVKVEKLSVQEEMNDVKVVDDKKFVAQSGVKNKKAPLDYNMVVRLSKKF